MSSTSSRTATASPSSKREATLEIDPQAAWLLLLDALATGHWRVVRCQAEDILEWIRIDGDPPDTSHGKVNDRFWNRQIANYSCKLARLIARRQLRSLSGVDTRQR